MLRFAGCFLSLASVYQWLAQSTALKVDFETWLCNLAKCGELVGCENAQWTAERGRTHLFSFSP